LCKIYVGWLLVHRCL
nr:immunoglobulin heavy chain junction region [Mus musculus]